MKHHAAVLAAGKEHHRPLRGGGAFAQDLDRFRLQPVEMVAPYSRVLSFPPGGAG
jgi:hypothetical protein